LWIAIAGLGGLPGCAAMQSAQQTASGWFGEADGRGEGKPQARYSAAAGVVLHRKPDASSEVVGKLALHEGVLSYQRKDGFAYVTSAKGGLSGWVREQQLIERLPMAAKPVVAAPAGAAEEPAVQEPPAPEEAPEPETPPAEPPEKSIFDPY